VLVAVGILVLVAAVILGLEALERRSTAGADVPAGSVPLYRDGKLVAALAPEDLEGLSPFSFIDAEEGKEQSGWLLRDVIGVHLDPDELDGAAVVRVSSSSREKEAVMTWHEVADPANAVMLDLANRGTLKLVSVMPSLDTRDEWVQDVDRVEVTGP